MDNVTRNVSMSQCECSLPKEADYPRESSGLEPNHLASRIAERGKGSCRDGNRSVSRRLMSLLIYKHLLLQPKKSFRRSVWDSYLLLEVTMTALHDLLWGLKASVCGAGTPFIRGDHKEAK